MNGDRIWRLFGKRHRDCINGKLQTIMERVERGQHVFRAYWKHAWIKQYEKYRTFLRNEITSNNLKDFKLNKGLAYLGAVRTKLIGILDRFELREADYGLNSLRHDLRKLKGHGLLERETGRYAYRLTEKGQRVAILFLLFHHRLCGPVAGSQFQNRFDPQHRPKPSKLEAAYHRADRAIDEIVELLRAA